ncbi:MAG: serine hydrolase domain-containing protein, partial [Acidimicrobiales bacterium]
MPPDTTTSTVPAVPQEAWSRFDEQVRDRLLGRSNQAVGVAVSINGHLVHVAAFGTRTPEDPTDVVTPTDRFRIASISKVVTSTVVLQLVAAGELTLDDPIGERLALIAGVAVGDPDSLAITVRQLLSHTSGIPKYRDRFFGDTFDSCSAAAAYGMARPLARRPGTRHEYSNLNYCLLTLLIENVSGKPYADAVAESLLEPLGITGMRLAGTNDPRPGEVIHVSGAGRTYMEALGGAGAWMATPADMVRILDSLDSTSPGWHPLPPGLAALMRQPLTGIDYPEPWERRYGLGIVVWPNGSWGHTGTVENTHTMLARRPDGVTWCILVSGDHPDSTESLADVFD